MQFKRVIKTMGAAAMLIAFSTGLYACTRSNAKVGSNTPESFTEPPTSVLYVDPNSSFGDFNGSTFKVGDKLMYGGSDYTGTVEYEIKAVNIYNDLNNFNQADLHMIGDEVFAKNGKIKEGYKFIVVDIGATCSKASKDDYEGMKNAQCIACFDPAVNEELKTDDQRPKYKYSSELPYFKLEEAEGIARSKYENGYYYYSLPEGKTANIQIGFFMPKEAMEKDIAYLSFNSLGTDEANRHKYMRIK